MNPEKIALTGWSFGGYLAPRAASAEHRLAACIADPGLWDLLESMKARFSALPKEVLEKFPDVDPEVLKPLEEHLRATPALRWATVQREMIRFTDAEGVGDHCEAKARTLFRQRAFDWLDDALSG